MMTVRNARAGALALLTVCVTGRLKNPTQGTPSGRGYLLKLTLTVIAANLRCPVQGPDIAFRDTSPAQSE